ncbi:MAG: rhamnulokinase family protein [Candidatus Latescibacteria bacterium]|nr:rhamnulokinase family protein [Candidatus Latescibacterota bacterium]
MAETANYLAYDLGASSGRAVIGRFDGTRVSLEEVHRFPNAGTPVLDRLYWDVLGLFEHLIEGLRRTVHTCGSSLMGVGIDTWGVDYALLDDRDELLGNPRCYRDPRVQGMMEEAFRRVPRGEIFEQTGIQFLELNTLYQLLAMSLEKSPQLDMARTLLMMPDLFNYWLTGEKASEFTIATTTQFHDPRKGDWALDLLERLNIPTGMLPEVVPPGTALGPIRSDIAEEVGLTSAEVIAAACHDTGAAVAAVPLSDADSLYVSCGTWALLGTELSEPAITPSALAHNFTNEGGVCGTYRFLKNISGLWLVQECKRIWEREGRDYGYDELTQMAADATPLRAAVDPDAADFLSPGDMPARIREACRSTGQAVPESEGAVIRCALESLALKIRYTLGQLEEVLGKRMKTIHLVGGGIQNTLLCQLTADATGRPAVAGPVEATALGNILMQALARGQVGSLAEIREVVRNSTDLITYEPGEPGPWDEAYELFVKLL